MIAPFDYYDIIAVNEGGYEILERKNDIIDLSKYCTNSNKFTTVGILDNSTKKEYPLFDLIHQPCIRDIAVQIFDFGKRAIVNFSLLCGCSAEISVINENGDEYYNSGILSDRSEASVILKDVPTGKYILIIKMVKADDFGFDTEKTEAYKKHFVCGDIFKYLLDNSSEIQIKKCDVSGSGDYRKIENFYFEDVKTEILGASYHANAFFYMFSNYSPYNYRQRLRWLFI